MGRWQHKLYFYLGTRTEAWEEPYTCSGHGGRLCLELSASQWDLAAGLWRPEKALACVAACFLNLLCWRDVGNCCWGCSCSPALAFGVQPLCNSWLVQLMPLPSLWTEPLSNLSCTHSWRQWWRWVEIPLLSLLLGLLGITFTLGSSQI